MRRNLVFIICSIVIILIIISQILLTKKLDLASFTQLAGTSKYDNSRSGFSSSIAGQKVNLRETVQKNVSDNINPFIVSFDEISLIELVGNKPYEGTADFESSYQGLFAGYTVESRLQKEGNYVQFSKNEDGKMLIGGRKTALVIPTVDRPSSLLKTVDRIIEVLQMKQNVYTVDLFISQDGSDQSTTTTIQRISSKVQSEIPFCSFSILQHKAGKLDVDSSYLRLSSHFFWIFDTLFSEKQYDNVILLEDDMFIADDFFSYMSSASLPLLIDTTIFCVLAMNDNGQAPYIQDPQLVFRTDYVSPGSILLTSSIFTTIKSEWSLQFWRQWIQSDTVRQGRACIRPEINRVIPISDMSTTQQNLNWEYQKELVLQSSYVNFSDLDFSYLVKDNFDMIWKKAIEDAVLISNLSELVLVPVNKNAKILYTKAPGKSSFYSIASEIGIMSDYSSKVPRTAYMGVISIFYQGIRLFIVPEEGPSFDY